MISGPHRMGGGQPNEATVVTQRHDKGLAFLPERGVSIPGFRLSSRCQDLCERGP